MGNTDTKMGNIQQTLQEIIEEEYEMLNYQKKKKK